MSTGVCPCGEMNKFIQVEETMPEHYADPKLKIFALNSTSRLLKRLLKKSALS